MDVSKSDRAQRKAPEPIETLNAILRRYAQNESSEEEAAALLDGMKRYRSNVHGCAMSRPYNALMLRFFVDQPESPPQIAVRLHTTKRTAFRDIEKAKRHLAICLFGIDGLLLINSRGRGDSEGPPSVSAKDVRILLRNYRLFNAFAEGNTHEHGESDRQTAALILCRQSQPCFGNTVTEESTRRNKQRTAAICDFINEAVQRYKAECMASPEAEEKRRYRVVNEYYIDEKRLTIDRICSIEQIERRTVYRDIQHAVNRISFLLFRCLSEGGEHDGE
ncbi:MAG: hypothetical protein PHD67_05660 [Oscillospiraceae bacterium]|nr:hypothetical protein [Oscillospiraceae bacterium]